MGLVPLCHYPPIEPKENTMKLIAENQLVGDGLGCAMFRDLFENALGERISVRKSKTFDMQSQRKLGEVYPPKQVLFDRFRLA